MSDKPDLPGRADYAMAFRAIALAEGLSGDAKRVAAIILGHFNTTTGQCDPGTERLMSKANVSKRTVVNATNDLHRLGLVVKIRHGGNGFRSRYQPNWTLFRAIVQASKNDEIGSEIVQNAALRQCKSVHLDSAKACTLTNNRNLSKKLMHSDGASGGVQSSDAEDLDETVSALKRYGLLSGNVRSPSSRKQSLPSVVSAQGEARLRINTWMDTLSGTTRGAIDRIMTAEVEQAAIVAELKTPNAGRELIMDRVSRRPEKAGRH